MLNRTQAVALSLVAMVGVAWAYLVPATTNYLYYYSALDQLGVNVTGMSISTYHSNVTVAFQFSISNPTPYVGLRIVSVAYQARLSNDTAGGAVGVGSASPGAVIDQHSTLQIPASFVVTGPAMASLVQMCKVSGGLSWSIEGSLGLGTRDGVLSHSFRKPVTSQC